MLNICTHIWFYLFNFFFQQIIGNGNVLSVNPDRVVVKRTVLSGHPFKVHKHSAVVRFLFFNREDIDWFKPVELRTKYGRRGHIKEPLGIFKKLKLFLFKIKIIIGYKTMFKNYFYLY